MGIVINVEGAYNDKDIKRVQRDIDTLGAVAAGASRSFSDQFAAIGAGMERAGATMTKSVTLPIVAGGALLVKAFTEEEDAIA
jgi:hypothetical protein